MILAILQARVSSTRLPGKVMKPVMGEPMLQRQVERVLRSRKMEQLVIATSTEQQDDPIESLCAKLHVACFRGSLDDVLDRFYQAAKPFHPEYVVRLTGDCPLADPEVIDACIDLCINGGYDYCSNSVEPTFPDGLDVEVMRFHALEQAWREATLPSHREHVTLFLHTQPKRFKVGLLKNPQDLSALRWTVDEPKDFELISRIFEALYPAKADFGFHDVLNFLAKHPELSDFNTQHHRNEGLARSLEKDRRQMGNQ